MTTTQDHLDALAATVESHRQLHDAAQKRKVAEAEEPYVLRVARNCFESLEVLTGLERTEGQSDTLFWSCLVAEIQDRLKAQDEGREDPELRQLRVLARSLGVEAEIVRCEDRHERKGTAWVYRFAISVPGYHTVRCESEAGARKLLLAHANKRFPDEEAAEAPSILLQRLTERLAAERFTAIEARLDALEQADPKPMSAAKRGQITRDLNDLNRRVAELEAMKP